MSTFVTLDNLEFQNSKVKCFFKNCCLKTFYRSSHQRLSGKSLTVDGVICASLYTFKGKLNRHKRITSPFIAELICCEVNQKHSYLFLIHVQDWGKPGDLFNLNIQWHIPTEDEKLLAKELLDTFLQPELTRLEKFLDESLTLSR